MSNRELVTTTLNALVDEAYQHALDRGVAITNPDAWRAWKRNVYAEQARREGPGYLRKHHQRLGLNTSRTERPACPKCGASILTPTQRDDDPTTYCSYTCAGIRTMSLTEWLDTQATPEQRDNMTRLRRRQEGAA